MKNLRFVTGFILMTLLFSCEEVRQITVRCDDCYEEDLTIVNIEVRLDTRFDMGTLSIFEGNLEDNVLYDSFTTSSASAVIKVQVNKKYTLTATYYHHTGRYYEAVDEVTPHVAFEENACESPCYYPYNNKADLRIKYFN